jgi:hypothetical protein
MNLLDLLDSVGGQESLGKLASNLGLDASKTNDLVGALAPALMGAMKKQTGSQDGLAGLKNALQSGKHQAYLNNPESMSSPETVQDGNNILGHILGSKNVSRNVAAQAAQSTGIDASLIKQALPLIASLAMGAMSKSGNAAQSLDNPDSAGDLFGSLMGGDGIDMDDVLNLAKKFF